MPNLCSFAPRDNPSTGFGNTKQLIPCHMKIIMIISVEIEGIKSMINPG